MLINNLRQNIDKIKHKLYTIVIINDTAMIKIKNIKVKLL